VPKLLEKSFIKINTFFGKAFFSKERSSVKLLFQEKVCAKRKKHKFLF